MQLGRMSGLCIDVTVALAGPRLVFFGAATENQDQGQNPSHVNENSFAYWAAKFAKGGYALDLASSALLRRVP